MNTFGDYTEKIQTYQNLNLANKQCSVDSENMNRQKSYAKFIEILETKD